MIMLTENKILYVIWFGIGRVRKDKEDPLRQ